MVKKNGKPGLAWWTKLAANVITFNKPGIAITLADIPKFFREDEATNGTDAAIREHMNGILEKVHSPLPIEPDLSLWGIYVAQGAKCWINDENPKKEEVQDFLKALKKKVHNSTLPLVVHGQPGHGKTSAMRMLAQVKALDPNDLTNTILFYEFKNLGNLNSTWIQTLQRVTPFIKDQAFFHQRQTVLILDGMDEWQITEGADQNLGNFIRDISLLAERVNKENNSRLNVVFTGRTLFVNQIKRYFTCANHQFEIADFNEEQIDRWLQKYNQIKKLYSPIAFEFLKEMNLEELAKQPLLLTMICRFLTNSLGKKMLQELPADEISRGRIYQTIISWTLQKEYTFEKPIPTIPCEEIYSRFLKMVAFAMFRTGGENIPLRVLASELKSNNDYYQLEEILTRESDIVQVIKRLSVGFFFEGRDEMAFSFLHKSIKDYLIVEAIFVLLTEAFDRFDLSRPEKSNKDSSEDIYFILGKNPMTFEGHLPFILDLLSQRGVPEFQQKLIAFIGEAECHKFLIRSEGGQNSNSLITEVNVLGSLIYWIFGMKAEGSVHLFVNRLVRIMKGVNFHYRFYLRGIDLSHSYMTFTELNGADLSYSNLDHIALNVSILDEADLTMASLQSADLRGAHLGYACFNGADLRSAKLCGAYVDGTNFSQADLRMADLRGLIEWEGAFWKCANIFGIKNAPDGFTEFVLSMGAIEVPPDGWDEI